LQKVRQEIIEDESLSALPNGALMISLAKAIKLIHITWNVKNEELFGLNVLYRCWYYLSSGCWLVFSFETMF